MDCPQLILREASKQRGTLLVVPEQGMRLQASAWEEGPRRWTRRNRAFAKRRAGVPGAANSLDAHTRPRAGRAMGQVTSLQHALVNEARVKVTANLQYQIENTGLKAFRVPDPDQR